ncbi:hypothetical protein PCE1_002029 [Barthelona sp. PCE]
MEDFIDSFTDKIPDKTVEPVENTETKSPDALDNLIEQNLAETAKESFSEEPEPKKKMDLFVETSSTNDEAEDYKKILKDQFRENCDRNLAMLKKESEIMAKQKRDNLYAFVLELCGGQTGYDAIFKRETS